MAEDEKVRLSVDAVLEGGSIAKLTEELASGIAKATTEGGKRSQEQFGKYIAAAMDAGTSSWNPERTGKKFTKIMEKAKAIQLEIVSAMEKGDTDRAKYLERERKKEMTQLQRVAARRKSAYQEVKKLEDSAMDERVDAYTSKMEKGISGIFAGDIGGLFKGAGKGMQQKGDAAAQKAKDVNASKTAKAMGMIGKGMAGFGTMMMTVGAVAGMVVMLVKAFIALDDRIKDMNKSIVGTATAADFGLGSASETASEFGSKLEEIRGSILDQSRDWKGWRQSSESMFQVLGAMNEMNLTFEKMDRQIKDTSNSLNSYADISIRAVAYGRLLGVSSQQAGSDMAKMANEFGVGLDVISQGLHAVHTESMLSGFSTKRFYSTILEVTSGLGAYNIRLEEASQLLSALDLAGGEVAGGAAFGEIAGQNQMKSAGVMDALEQILLKGTGHVAKIFADEASSKASLLFTQLDEEQQKSFADRFGLDASSARAFGESFAKKAPDQKDVGEFLASILRTDGSQGVAMKTGQMAGRLADAGKGHKSSIIQSYGDLGAASRMRFAMKLPKMLEGNFSSLADLMASKSDSAIAAMAVAEKTMGMSRDQLVQYADTIRSMEAGLTDLRKKGKGAAVDDVIKTSQGNFRKTKGGFEKVELDENGKFVKALGGTFKDLDGYLDSMNDYIANETKTIDADLDAAKATVSELDKLSTVMEENIAAILNDIYTTLLKLWYWISGDQEQRDKQESNRKNFESKIKLWTRENQEEQKQAKADMGKAPKGSPAAAAAATRLEKSQGRGMMLENMDKAANRVDPTKYDTPGAYMDAVYKEAQVDKGEFGASQGQSSSRGTEDLPAPSRKEWGTKEDGTYGETGEEVDLTSLLMHQVERMEEMNPNFETYSFGEKPKDKYWKEYDTFFKDSILSQVGPDQKEKYTKMWGVVKGSYDKWPWEDSPTKGTNAVGLPGYQMKYAIQNTIIDPLTMAIQTGEFNKTASEYDVKPAKAEDMYVPSGGRPVLLNSKDEFLAMKKGGAIDNALGGGGGGGGGITVINNFDGPVTEALVRKAVGEGILMAKGKRFA